MLNIDSDIPLPHRRTSYPLEDMKIGDSFLVPIANRNSALTSGRKLSVAHPEYRFTSRSVGNDMARIWRITTERDGK